MPFCKITFVGNSLHKPIRNLLLCMEEVSKNPFPINWAVDDVLVDVENDLADLFAKQKEEESLINRYSTILEKIKGSSGSKVVIDMKIVKSPPFELLRNLQQLYKDKGLESIRIVFHSHQGKYGIEEYLANGDVISKISLRESVMAIEEVDKMGLPLEYATSATFVEKLPQGNFSDFLKKYDLEY
jgi:hypothetical protein